MEPSSRVPCINSLNAARTIVGTLFLGKLVVLIPKWLGKFSLSVERKGKSLCS